ncbi:hypothetical protein ACTXT7_005450 [Hymenolepis weldensis]
MAFVPYLPLTPLNPHCALINTFWLRQLMVSWSVAVVVNTGLGNAKLAVKTEDKKLPTSAAVRVRQGTFLSVVVVLANATIYNSTNGICQCIPFMRLQLLGPQ